MKVASAIAAACFIASAGAFAPMPVPAPGAGLLRHRHAATRLFADLKTAEAAAVSATKQFGIKSPQAVSAWEEFEEIASADNSAASKPGLDEACAVDDLAACAEFDAQMAELQKIIDSNPQSQTQALLDQNKKLIDENQRLRRSLGAYK